jgi:hypothetical protein
MVHVGVHHQIPCRSRQGKKNVQCLQIVHKGMILKGLGHQINTFFEAYIIQAVLYVYAHLDGF